MAVGALRPNHRTHAFIPAQMPRLTIPLNPGGSGWESNPPRPAERPAAGFEDRGAHRDPTTPKEVKHTATDMHLQGKDIQRCLNCRSCHALAHRLDDHGYLLQSPGLRSEAGRHSRRETFISP